MWPQSHHDLLTILQGMLFRMYMFFSCALSSWRHWLLLCILAAHSKTSPMPLQALLWWKPLSLTFHNFSVLVSTLLTPECMGTSFWLFMVRLRVCSSSAGTCLLYPSIILLDWSSLPTLCRSMILCDVTHYRVWALLLSSFPFLSLHSCIFLLVSSPVLLCDSSPSLPSVGCLSASQPCSPGRNSAIFNHSKSRLRVSCANPLSWKAQRLEALGLQLFIASFF